MYFNQRKWAAHASCALSDFHTSCGTEKNFLCPGAGFQGGSLGKWLYFYKVLFKNKNSSSETQLLALATLLHYPHLRSKLGWFLFFTKFTFPFWCCFCWKLALRPYICWALVENPYGCYLPSGCLSCRSHRSGLVGCLVPGAREQKELSCLPTRGRQEYFVQPLQPRVGPKISSWPTASKIGAP